MIAFSYTGKLSHTTVNLLLSLGFLIGMFLICWSVVRLTLEADPPPPVQQHQLSDLDKGSIPSSAKYGKLGEPGPQGPRGEPGVNGIDGLDGVAVLGPSGPPLEPPRR